MKGSGVRAKDIIFLNSISSKKNSKPSDSNDKRKERYTSDYINDFKKKLIQDFDFEALLNSEDARVVSVNRISSNPEEEVVNPKGNIDKDKKRKRKNKVSKNYKDEMLELRIEVDKPTKIKKKNSTSVKGNSEDDDGWLSLRTRASPKVLYQLMKKLTLRQRKDLIQIGFGSLYYMAIEEVPVKIGHYVVDRFSASDMKIKLRDYDIVITPELIHKVLDIPLGGIDFNDLEKIRVSDLSKRWYSQFESIRYPTPHRVAHVVEKSEIDGILFNLNILVLFSNFFGLGGKGGQCKPQQILNYIREDTEIKKIDWSKYVFDCLKNSKENWERVDDSDNLSSYYSGPLTALIVSFHFYKY